MAGNFQRFFGRWDDMPVDSHELIALVAPRPVFINAPVGDTNFKWRSVDEIEGAATQVYQLYGAQEKLRVEHPGGGHDFPAAMREEAYRMIEVSLRE